MSIDNIIKYIDSRNNSTLHRGGDDFHGFVLDAISQHMTASSARSFMQCLATNDAQGVLLMMKCFLEAEYDERAETLELANESRLRDAILRETSLGAE